MTFFLQMQIGRLMLPTLTGTLHIQVPQEHLWPELWEHGMQQPAFQDENNGWNKRTLTPLNTQSFKIRQILLEIKKTAPNELQ